MFKALRELKESFQRLSESLASYKALKKDSPETAALALKLSRSEEGKFVIDSGVLTPDELASLSGLQLARFLNGTTNVVRMLGKEAFMESIPETRKALLRKLNITEMPNKTEPNDR
ncbi:MAG: hypothetical protein GWO24_06335 [Akkermansiaceae bacterium]|nr:hypothetical protein [Akkermansiaceae bacterium]